MPAGLYGRVSSSTSNSNANVQNGSTGRNGHSGGGAPNGAVRLRGTIGKYNGSGSAEYEVINPGSAQNYILNRVDQTFGCPTWSSGQTHPTHTFVMNSGIASTFYSNQSGFTPQTYADATRNNVRLSDYYRSSSSTARVPDTMGNYVTIPTSGEIRMSTFRDQAQAPSKLDLKTSYQQLAGPQTNTYRYSSTQGANFIGNTLFTVNINVTDNPGSNTGVETSGTGGYSYYANYYGPQGGSLNTYGYGRYPGPTRFTGNHTSYDNGTVANYHTSGSRYNTSISLDLWMGPKIGWGADSPSYMTPQTYSFLGGGYATSSDLRNRSLWKGFLKTEWTTIYIQHTALAGFPTTPISNFTVYAYDPYKDFSQIYGSQTWAYSAANSIGSKTFSPTLVTNHDSRFRSYYIQVPTNIANIHRIMGTFYKNSSNIISLRTLSFFPGKFTFSSVSANTNGGTVTSGFYSSSNDNGYGFVLVGMGASRSPDSSMYGTANLSASSNRLRRLQVNADYWYDGNLHEVGVLDTSTASQVSASVSTTGRMVSARGPYLDVGIADQYQD